jgi:hypothetical protein
VQLAVAAAAAEVALVATEITELAAAVAEGVGAAAIDNKTLL